MKYGIIIPAKNEETTIGITLESVLNQTIKPEICLVIDDGSTDKTAEIINSIKERCDLISYYLNSGEKTYSLGGHVVELFNLGQKILIERKYFLDYIVKLDADISFQSDFMEQVFKNSPDKNYGIVSGTPYYLENEKKIMEISPYWHTHGQFKIYNTKCLSAIDGLKMSLGWDTADNIQAISAGWETMALREINYLMYRKIGGKTSLSKGRINHGIGAFRLGYGYFYFLLKSFHDIFKPPYLVGSLNMIYGFIKAHFGDKRILDQRQIKILRKLLWKSFSERLFHGRFVFFQRLKRKSELN